MDVVNKIGEDYFVICILGKTECEEKKIFYKKQWLECYDLLDKFMEKLKEKMITSKQFKVEISTWGKDGYPKTNYKKLPSLENLKWNKENNIKISEKHLNELLFQIKNAENENIKHYKWLEKMFPEIKNTISFECNEIIGGINNKKSFDFIFKVYNAGENNYYNQEVNIFLSKTYMELQKNNVETFYKNIEVISKSVLTGITNMPLGINIKEDGMTKMVSLWSNRFGVLNKLELKENPIGKWKII